MNFEKDNQNTFSENQNRLCAVLERKFSRDFHTTICIF